MKKVFVRCLILSVIMMATKTIGWSLNNEAEACWQRGLQAALLSKDYVPGKIYVKFERLDGEGKTKDQNETWLELLPGDKEVKLVKAFENGKDITQKAMEKERVKREKNKNGGGHFINLSSDETVPFVTNSEKPVTYKFFGKESQNGMMCNVYEFQKEYISKKETKQKTSKHRGKIWLDATSGMPVKSSYTSNPLPSGVKQMEMNTTFFTEKDKFFIKDHKMYIKAGFLFINKRFRLSLVLGGYRKSDKGIQDLGADETP